MQSTVTKDDNKVEAMFQAYQDPSGDTIGPEGNACMQQASLAMTLASIDSVTNWPSGIERLCQDLGVDPADRKVSHGLWFCSLLMGLTRPADHLPFWQLVALFFISSL